jgi:hypothetical protein
MVVETMGKRDMDVEHGLDVPENPLIESGNTGGPFLNNTFPTTQSVFKCPP